MVLEFEAFRHKLVQAAWAPVNVEELVTSRAVKVVVRCRPLNSKEAGNGNRVCVDVQRT